VHPPFFRRPSEPNSPPVSTPSRGPARTRVLTTLVVTAALALLAAPAPAAVSDTSPAVDGRTSTVTTTIRVSPDFFGIQDGSQQAYGRISFGSLRLWDAGVTWRNIETSPGVYNWHGLDTLVSAAQAHGVQVTLVLAMTPSFYADAATLPPTELSHYADYVRAVMNRYRSFNGQRGIAAYQVWNEGNVSSFWTGTPYQLAELTGIVHDVRDEVDPGATVVAPSFAMRLKYQSRWFAQYQAQQVDGSPVWRYYDANALSLYPMATYGDRAGGPEDAMALAGQARHLLAQAGAPSDTPLWGSEVNYGLVSGATPGDGAATPIPERRQVANVIRTYLLGAARGLSGIFWYRYDWKEISGGGTLGNTLLATPGAPDQPTAAGLALATTKTWLHGRLVGVDGHRPCARDGRGTFTCIVRYSGGVRRIYWNPLRRVDVRLRADATSRQTALGVTKALDRSRTTIRVGAQPVMVNSPSAA
jgi:hypothetical protein